MKIKKIYIIVPYHRYLLLHSPSKKSSSARLIGAATVYVYTKLNKLRDNCATLVTFEYIYIYISMFH